MDISLHKNVRTTPKIRAEIRASKLSNRELARRYNVNIETIRKWRRRDTVQDRSSRPKSLQTTLTPLQETVIVILREGLFLSLDDLTFIARKYLNERASRSGIDRLLRRHGISNLRQMLPREEAEKCPKKTFKDYEPGYLHVDVKYLPKLPNQTHRSCLFVAIDRATRWVYLEIMPDKTARTASRFLANLRRACPVKIRTILTDNGAEFIDRISADQNRPTGRHAFDKACTKHNIDHRLTPVRSPQTNKRPWSGTAATGNTKRHGRALQRPHQRGAALYPFC